MRDPMKHAEERFAADIAEHVVTVQQDDGPYRHLRCAKPGTGMYWFELVTWPGALAIRGDMGDLVFARLDDMFEFFRGERVNPVYWSEKITTGRDEVRAYSEDLLRRMVEEYVFDYAADLTTEDEAALRAAVQADVLSSGDLYYAEGAQLVLNDFSHVVSEGQEFRFHDTGEWELTGYTHRFLWCCHAIVWAINQYDSQSQSREAPRPASAT